ncbi:MAG: hypothetical protein JXM74_02575 [Fusobacteriaceae bacterium]|nr:hypothetical protein [Fusobacteriaceae bacterium]
MKHIINILKEDSKKLDNPMELKILREIIEPAFKELINNAEEIYNHLEKRVYEDISLEEEDYEVITSLIKIEEINYHNRYFSPIIPIEKFGYDKEELLKKLKNGLEANMGKIYIPISYEEITKLLNSSITGNILSKDGKSCQITLNISETTDFIDKEKEIYNLFYKNNIKWKTINNPYARRFFDLNIVKVKSEIMDIDTIDSIDCDFNGIEVRRDLIPVWNIFEEGKSISLGIEPAEDSINYSYKFDSEGMKSEGNTVIPYVTNAEIKAIFKEDNGAYRIICDKDENVQWIFYIFKKINFEKFDTHEFNLFRNQRDSIFNRFNIKTDSTVRSKIEIIRKTNDFGQLINLKFKDLIIEKNYEKPLLNLDLNSFVRDEIRKDKINDFLILKFENNSNHFLSREIMSFVVSEIQNDFPDLKCVGEFL